MKLKKMQELGRIERGEKNLIWKVVSNLYDKKKKLFYLKINDGQRMVTHKV